MMLRLPFAIAALAVASLAFGQDKKTLHSRMSEAEQKCVERIRSASPESAEVARQSMNTCRQEREAAEGTDQKTGNQEARLAFILKYTSEDSTRTAP